MGPVALSNATTNAPFSRTVAYQGSGKESMENSESERENTKRVEQHLFLQSKEGITCRAALLFHSAVCAGHVQVRPSSYESLTRAHTLSQKRKNRKKKTASFQT